MEIRKRFYITTVDGNVTTHTLTTEQVQTLVKVHAGLYIWTDPSGGHHELYPTELEALHSSKRDLRRFQGLIIKLSKQVNQRIKDLTPLPDKDLTPSPEEE